MQEDVYARLDQMLSDLGTNAEREIEKIVQMIDGENLISETDGWILYAIEFGETDDYVPSPITWNDYEM